MSHRFWGNAFLGKTYSVFGKNRLRFCDKLAPFLGKNGSISGGKLARFLDWLGTKLKFHCFEREACLGLDLLFFLNWVSLK